MKEFDLLVAGEINPDLILTGDVEPAFGQVEKLVDSAAMTIGSSSAIFACGAARLGLKVAFIGKCGEDIFGRFMINEMAARHINTDHIIVEPEGSTGLSVILNRGNDRAILTQMGLIVALREKDISDDLLSQSRHLHVASYYLQTSLRPRLKKLFSRAHALGLTTSLDTNFDPDKKWLGLDELLIETDIFLPNEKEALSITKTSNAEEAGRQLIRKAKLLAIKRGTRGAIGFQNDYMIDLPARPVEVVDTIGAGDSFDAGFIFGFLQGWPLEKSLRAAIFCGTHSTQGAGGTSSQATLDEVMSELS